MRLGLMISALTLVAAVGCSVSQREPVSRNPASDTPLSASDTHLKTGSGGMTVWKAQQMAKSDGGLAELDRMFREDAVSLDGLPVGYAAGAAAQVLYNVGGSTFNSTLVGLTGANWRGKIFCKGTPKASHGLNRIQSWLTLPIDILDRTQNVVPMAAFKTFLIPPEDPRNLAKDARTNVVVLNYAQPVTTGTFVEESLANAIQVYDVMVAVPGEFGPIYLGKTWKGKYDSKGNFQPDSDALIARYYLDFNPQALKAQKEDPNLWPAGQQETALTDTYHCPGVTLPQ